jgi:hypothetical protein
MPKQDPFLRYAVTSFYHFTDRRNAASIKERGGLYSLAALRKMGLKILTCPRKTLPVEAGVLS